MTYYFFISDFISLIETNFFIYEEICSEVSLFESEIEIEMKRHKIISIIEIEIQLK